MFINKYIHNNMSPYVSRRKMLSITSVGLIGSLSGCITDSAKEYNYEMQTESDYIESFTAKQTSSSLGINGNIKYQIRVNEENTNKSEPLIFSLYNKKTDKRIISKKLYTGDKLLNFTVGLNFIEEIEIIVILGGEIETKLFRDSGVSGGKIIDRVTVTKNSLKSNSQS